MAVDFLELRPAVTVGDSDSDARTVAEVTEIIDQLSQDFSGRNKLYQQINETIFGEVTVDVPKAFADLAKPVRSPLALHMAKTVVAALTVNAPATLFQPVGFGDTHQINATLREHFFDASWLRQEDEADAPLFRLFMWDVVTLGEGVLKTVQRSRRAWHDYGARQKKILKELDDDDRYTGLDTDSKDRAFNERTEEYKRAAPYPICTIDVPPETFMYRRTEDGFSLAAEVKKVPYHECLSRYGAGLDRGGRVVSQAMGLALPESDWRHVMGREQMLTMLEVWKWDTCEYILLGPGQTSSQSNQLGRGTMVRKFKHGYGDPVTKTLRGPYFHCRGTTTSKRLPDKAGLSLFYGFLDVFRALDTMLSIQQINAVLYGLGMFKRTQAPGVGPDLPETEFGRDGTEQAKAEEVKVGQILPYDVSAVDPPRGGVDLDKAIVTNRGLIDQALPSVLQGIVDTTESGAQLAQAVHIGRLAFDPLIDNAERALGRRVGFESWLIEKKIQETVYVWGEPPKKGRKRSADAGWLGLGPDELNGVHRYKVRLNPETPTNRVVDIRMHAEMVKNQFETRAQAIEALGGNPDEVERGLLLEMLKQDPAVMEKLKQRTFEELGLADQQAMAGAGEAAVGGGEPGSALGGLGEVFQIGQNLPIQPTVPGTGQGIPSSPGGAPAGIRSLPPGMPSRGQG